MAIDEYFVPYEKPVQCLVVQQLTQVGWVDLIRLPVEQNEKAKDPEKVQSSIEKLNDMFYKMDRVYLSIQGMQVCVQGIERGGTFRVCASYTPTPLPFIIV